MDTNGKVSPWIFVVVLGVIAILFAVFGLQQQTEEQATKDELAQTKVQLLDAERHVEELKVLASEMAGDARELESRLEECIQNKKR